MTKEQAIEKYKAITSGSGVSRNDYIGEDGPLQRGNVAVFCWNSGEFTIGIEYGYLIALIDAFGLTAEDLA